VTEDSLWPGRVAQPGRRCGRPHDLKHRRISLLHAQGKSWAQIAELVGNRSPKVLSDTYTHVLMDEPELDYAALIAELLPKLAPEVRSRCASRLGGGSAQTRGFSL